MLLTMRILLLFALVAANALATEADALAIDRNIQQRHLPFSTILDPFLDSNDQVTGYTRCGDSALWTGHYLAAEAFRYKVTKSPEALDNARRLVFALQYLMNVTGRKVLSRCAVRADSPFAAGIIQEESNNGVFINNYYGDDFYWIGNTSRDQYIGVFWGLGIANELIDDVEIRALCADVVTRLLDGLLENGWLIVMPDGRAVTSFSIRPDQQLSMLLVGQRANPNRFRGEYSRYKGLAPSVPVPIGVEALDDRSSYFKFNLDALSLYSLLMYEGGSYYRFWYNRGYDIFHDTVKDHQNAHFNMIDRALHGPDTRRDAETRQLLEQWLSRQRRDLIVDLRGKYPSCGAPDQACDPVPVAERPPTDFLWQRSPFQLLGGLYGTIEGAGIDYILPYWMARYYGVLGAD